MSKTMRAVVVEKPGGLEALEQRRVPIPELQEGEMLIRVRAVAINNASVAQHQGLDPGVTYPRILGFDCVGEVAHDPAGRLPAGTKAVICFGIGRFRDGGYAEYMAAPAHLVRPFFSSLDWVTLASMGGAFVTASSAMYDICPPPEAGQTLLICGGTTGVGLAAANLGKGAGMHVIATTRSAWKAERLLEMGVDEVFVGDEPLAPRIGRRVNMELHLLGMSALTDALQCIAPQGTACVIGFLGNAEEVFLQDKVLPHPLKFIPDGVRLTARNQSDHGGHKRIQSWVDGLESGLYKMPINRVFPLEQIREAHAYRATFEGFGKIIVEIGE